jgi:hypothetical protein
MKSNDEGLNELLYTIQSYEQFARIITSAFYNTLFYLSDKNRKVQLKELEVQKFMKIDIHKLRELYETVYSQLTNYNESNYFNNIFGSFGLINNTRDFAFTLIDHHQRIQKNKPPFGKAPWLESFGDSSYMIRPLYRQEEPAGEGFEYVNRYRINSLISFLDDLI